MARQGSSRENIDAGSRTIFQTIVDTVRNALCTHRMAMPEDRGPPRRPPIPIAEEEVPSTSRPCTRGPRTRGGRHGGRHRGDITSDQVPEVQETGTQLTEVVDPTQEAGPSTSRRGRRQQQQTGLGPRNVRTRTRG